MVNTRDAQLSLAEIPFVSLRHGLPTALLDGSARFEQAVAAARTAVGPAHLELQLPPAELAVLAVFARRPLAKLFALLAPPNDVADPEWSQRYLKELRIICGPLGDRDATEHSLGKGMGGHYFSMHLSKLRSRLRRELGQAAGPYLIDDGGRRLSSDTKI